MASVKLPPTMLLPGDKLVDGVIVKSVAIQPVRMVTVEFENGKSLRYVYPVDPDTERMAIAFSGTLDVERGTGNA